MTKALTQAEAQPAQLPPPKNIYQRMLAVMDAVSEITKSDKRVNGQFRYVTIDSVVEAVRPHLIKHGIVTIPRKVGSAWNGNMLEVDFEIDFVNVDDPADKITVPVLAHATGNDAMRPGKAASYAVKMCYLRTFNIVSNEDDDNEREIITHQPPARRSRAEELTDALSGTQEPLQTVTLGEILAAIERACTPAEVNFVKKLGTQLQSAEDRAEAREALQLKMQRLRSQNK